MAISSSPIASSAYQVSTTLSTSFDCGSGADFLVVTFSTYSGKRMVSMSYNGSSMNLGVEYSVANENTAIYYLASPSSGSNTLSASTTGPAGPDIQFTATSWSGIDQSSPVDVTNGVSSEDINITTSAENTLIIDTILDANDPITGTQTIVDNRAFSGASCGVQYRVEATSGTYSMNWTNSGANTFIRHSAIAFQEASAVADNALAMCNF